VLPVTQGITLDIIIEAIFGERDPERISLLHKDILAIVAAFNPAIATFKFAQREFGGGALGAPSTSPGPCATRSASAPTGPRRACAGRSEAGRTCV
jgi:hypothetical protein